MEKVNPTPEVNTQAGGALGRRFGAPEPPRRQLAYWKRYLEGAPASLQLPTDRLRPATLAHHVAEMRFDLGAEMSADLIRLSQRYQATLFMTIAAAFNVLLHRYSGQDDVCIGYPGADRNREPVEELSEFSVNTLILRTCLTPRHTFEMLLKEVRESVLEADAQQGVPFEKLVEELCPERDPSHSPLFQVMLALDDAAELVAGSPGYARQPILSRYELARLDLTLRVSARDGQLQGALQYNTDLFDRSTIERMARHFKTLLAAVTANPNQRVSRLPLLSGAERQQLLVQWNDTRADFPRHRCIHELFEAQVDKAPDAVAVVFEDQQLSYGELNARANQLAHYLLTLGVGPETLVALCVERSLEMVVILLGILKAGAAYVPLDTEYPPDRMSYILEDTAAPVLLTQARLKDRMPEHGARLVCIDGDWPIIAGQPTENPRTSVQPGNLAYCVYTSGSTGKPKAVAIPHSNLVNQTTHMKRELDVRPSDRMLQFTSISFDACLQEIFPTWLGGATLVLPPARMVSNRDFLRALHERRISILSLPYSYWKHLVDELSVADVNWLDTLRIVFVGGEKVLAEKYRQWKELPYTRDVIWMQDYGPTEGTQSCVTFIPEPASDWETQIPIGGPISNVQVYIFDDEMNPAPIGVVGELCLGGVGLARGYWNRPELTAEKFIPNPYGEPGARMYKTGDLAYYLPDGNIQFVGRVDHQVKILGHRIELGEIESALLRCEGVREAVVIAREDIPGDSRLVAYLVADDFDEAAVRIRLSETLPAVMMPAAFVLLAELPLSPVRLKLDRTRLPAPKAAGIRPALDGASELEQVIAALWTEIVERAPVTVDEDFFLAGGDSLRALRLLGKISDLTGLTLEFADFFRGRNVRSLSADLLKKYQQQNGVTDHRDHESEIVRRLRAESAARGPRLRRREAARRFASNAQQRLWFLSRMQAGEATYSETLGYRIRGDLSVQKVDSALTTIVARHEALRTGLIMHDGVLWQDIAPPMPIRSELLEAGSFDEAMRRAQVEAGAAFDLTQPPLLRSLCIRFSPHEVLLVFIAHHAVCDAWSFGIFWRELTALYSATETKTDSLADPQFQYADYVDWQREWLTGAEAEAQRAFWGDLLVGDLPLLRLNQALPTDEARSDLGAVERLQVHSGLYQAVSNTAKRHGTTDFVVALSAFLAVLHRYTRQDQIVVGLPAACRSFAETESIIGYFSNTLALRIFFTPGLSFSELINQTSKALADAVKYQELPFDQVVDLLELPRQSGSNPIFQAMFVMQNTPMDARPHLDGLEIEEVAVHSGTAKFDLTFLIRSTAAGLEGELEYSLDVFDKPAATRFAQVFLNLLSDSIARSSARIDQLTLISHHEAAEIIRASVDQFEVYTDFLPIHSYFEAQARRSPHAIAIEAGSLSISYANLNDRANRLARRLIDSGAAPESLIAICLDRSIELVVALLATLKAGSAFVPLDPAFPLERIRNICDDAGSPLVITQRHLTPVLAALRTTLIVEDAADVTYEDACSASDPDVATSPLNAAYVYYTSGSTGAPKGVIIDHLCAMSRLEWLRRRYPLSVGDRLLHKTPLIFDVAIWEIFGPLMAGATILMADPGAESDVAHIARLLSKPRTVFAHFVPSMLDAYLNFAPRANYPDLRWVQSSGEAVPARLYERYCEHFEAEFHNCYGQTETSEVAAWEGGECGGASWVPVGRQIGIYRLHVLDGDLNVVPPGVPGELCVAGEGGLARGYHRRAELTAEKFVPNPYGVAAGERLYRTGDLARLREDGVIEHLGRVDQQTKIRGCRVETGEVEAVLRRHSGVRGCAVVARADEGGAMQLVAYVVGEGVTAAELGAHAERYLPKYMLAAAYIFLDELPLTASGKLDRLRLPAPKAVDYEARASREEAETVLEAELAGMWKQVLGLERVGRGDNFFAVGGNSLKSMQVLVRVKEKYGVEVSVRKFFSRPTIEGLAEEIERGLMEVVRAMTDAEAERRLEELEV